MDAALRGLGMMPKIRQALLAILYEGRTWAEAAAAAGCTESGIAKAMRRLRSGRRCCPLCGSVSTSPRESTQRAMAAH